MYDEFQTQQFWDNMKKSQLKQLIKEEFNKILNEEKSLTDLEMPFNLPSIGLGGLGYIGAVTTINSKEDMMDYIEDFKKATGEEPKVKIDSDGKIEIINSNYKKLFKTPKDIDTKGD